MLDNLQVYSSFFGYRCNKIIVKDHHMGFLRARQTGKPAKNPRTAHWRRLTFVTDVLDGPTSVAHQKRPILATSGLVSIPLASFRLHR